MEECDEGEEVVKRRKSRRENGKGGRRSKGYREV